MNPRVETFRRAAPFAALAAALALVLGLLAVLGHRPAENAIVDSLVLATQPDAAQEPPFLAAARVPAPPQAASAAWTAPPPGNWEELPAAIREAYLAAPGASPQWAASSSPPAGAGAPGLPATALRPGSLSAASLVPASRGVTDNGGRVPVRWLAASGGGDMLAAMQQVVADFNASQTAISLTLQDVSDLPQALQAQINAGDPPDIVGPAGVAHFSPFAGQWLDLAPLISSTGYTLTDYYTQALAPYQEDGGQFGLPLRIYPSYIHYNKDLFDAAGLAYPPHEYGQPYSDTTYGGDWTMDKVAEIARLLTLDGDGYSATDPSFDRDTVAQFGYLAQWTDARGEATLFGADSFVAPYGNAQIPDNWRTAFHWYYDGLWGDQPFIPSESYLSGSWFGNGNAFDSNHVAMAHCHLWYICCLGDVPNWDIAALPAYSGTITTKMHDDGLGIIRATENPTAAFEALTYIVGDGAATLAGPQLLSLPARPSLQGDSLAALQAEYPDVDWQVMLDSIAYADDPNHESSMPDHTAAEARVDDFYYLYHSTGGLDIDAELETLRQDLQEIFHYRIKSVTPTGVVYNGDLLTYTVSLALTPTAEFGFYDPLTDTVFVGFVEQPGGIIYDDGAITGTFVATPTQYATISFVVELTAPVTATQITNQACVYALPGALEDCQWTNVVTNVANRVPVRWFVGLGAGTDPSQLAAQQQVVADFNASQTEIYLTLEIVENAVALETLQAEIEAGDPPDVVGPVGVRGSNDLSGQFLDLTPIISATGYDLSDFDPTWFEMYSDPGQGLTALPFDTYPSFIYYNKDLFDAAGLAYPPHEYGQPYTDTTYGGDWTMDKVAEIARLLTLDGDGYVATDPSFNKNNVVQFGYVVQWTDARGEATLFGADSFVGAYGDAQIPDNWRTAFHWYYDALWGNQPFIPSDTYINSEQFGYNNPFNSNHVAMAHCHLWYTCCLGDVSNWDIAAMPAYSGTITAKMHADAFRILQVTEHPTEAFQVMAYLVDTATTTLLDAYGGFPARISLQGDAVVELEAQYPDVDWQVMLDSIPYLDDPNHESNMPNFTLATDRILEFTYLYHSTDGLDMDAELDILREDLQAIFHHRIKSVAPGGQVNYGDLLRYTVSLSATPGLEFGFYDPLTDVTFVGFVEQPDGIVCEDGAITGTFVAGPTQYTTISFDAQVNPSVTSSVLVNRACMYPLPGTVDDCLWTNPAYNALPAPDVGVWKGIPSGGFARPGGKFVYVIGYWNDGNRVAEDVVIVDTLPLSTTYFGDTSGTTPEIGAGGVVTWHLDGPLFPPGYDNHWRLFAVTLDVSDTVPAGSGSLASNCASISTGTPGDTNYGNDTTCTNPVDVWESEAGVNLDKWPGPNDPAPGQEFGYTIRWCSDSGANFGPVWLTDTLPFSTTVVDWWADEWPQELWTEVITTGEQFVLYAPGLPGNWCQHIHLRLLLDPYAPLGTVLQNTAVITTPGDDWPDNNVRVSSDAHVSLPRYDMAVAKSMNSAVLVPGGCVDYHVDYWNQGNSPVHAWLTDTLPAGTSYMADSAYEQNGGPPFPPAVVTDEVVVWDLGEIGVNESLGLDYSIHVSGTVGPGTVITNCAAVGIAQTDDLPSNDTACAFETINDHGPNLRVTKQGWWNGDSQLGYRIQLYNVGDEEVGTVWLTDTYPVSTAVQAGSLGWDGGLSNVDCSDDGAQLVCQIQDCDPGLSAALWFNSDLDDPDSRPAWFTNTVEIGPPDGYPADNTATVVDVKREVEQVDLDIYRTRMWGYAPQGPITITDELEQMVLPWSGGFDIEFGDGFDPGEVVTVAAGNGVLPVVIHIPDPLSAYASSITDTVWGEIAGAGGQQVNIDLWDHAGCDVWADGDGRYSFTFPDVPRSAMGDVNYYQMIDYAQVGFHRRFQTPDLVMRVNYGHDWVEGQYPEAGHTLWITVTDSGSVVKGTAVLTTGAVPWWNGEIGFCSGWQGWTSGHPDIAPGDWVYAAMDNGYTSTARVGTITGTVDADADSVTGNIYAGWFTQTLEVWCEPWGGPGNAPSKYSTAGPDGTAPYFGQWDPATEWDIQPSSQIGVCYVEPDGDRVYNVFAPAHIQVRAFYDYHDDIEGNTTSSSTVWITVTDSLGNLKYTDSTVAQADGEYYAPGPIADIVPSDWVSATSSDGSSTSMQVIQIDGGVDVGSDTVSGLMSGPGATFPAQGLVRVHTTGDDSYFWDISIDGDGGYFLDMGSERDVVPEDEVQVFYNSWGENQTARSFLAMPHVKLHKQGGGSPGQGASFTFQISYQNNGASAAEDVVITDTLLYGMTYLSDTSGFSHTGSGTPGDPLVWQLGTLGTGADASFDVSVQITATAGEQITNTAQIATSSPCDQYRPWEYSDGWGKESSWSGEVQADTATTIASDTPDPYVVGQTVAVSVTVETVPPAAGTPTGAISVTAVGGGAPSCSITLSGGAGVCDLAFTVPGEVTITASYAGDAGFNASSDAVSHTVEKANTTTTITSDGPDPSVVGQSVTVSVTVEALAPGTGTPAGSVDVTTAGGGPSCAIILNGGSGACNLTYTSIGFKTIIASYQGSATLNESSDTAGHTVDKADTTTSITDDTPDPSVVGQTVTVSVTVDALAPGSGTPTGSVSVTVAGPAEPACWIALSGGSGTCDLTFASTGSKTIIAMYQGDARFNASFDTGGHTVEKADTTTTIPSHGPDPSVVGQTVAVSVTVETVPPAAGTPTGSISVTAVGGGAPSCSITFSDGCGSCDLAFAAAGEVTITASYAGDTGFNGSSNTESHTVDKADTTTTITSHAPDPSVVGQSVTVSVTVEAVAPGVGIPTGPISVTTAGGGAPSCFITLSAGSGACDLAFTSAGEVTITAAYAGNTSFLDSSGEDDHSVNKVDTTTTITSDSPDPSVVGQSVTVSVTVEAVAPGTGAPTGTVDVTTAGGGPSCVITLSDGSGACDLTYTSIGFKTIMASYATNASYDGSVGTAGHTVDEADTTTVITSDAPDPSVIGQSMTISVTVEALAPGSGTPTGSVSVTTAGGGGPSCPITLSGGSGACDLTFTSTGDVTITAAYAGNTSFLDSSGEEGHTVDKADSCTTITSDSPDPSVVGQSVMVTATVEAVAPGVGTPSGSISVTTAGGGEPSCLITLSGGSGACGLAFSSAGDVTITASYLGDDGFNAGSDAATHTVDRANSALTIASDSPDPSVVGQSVTVSVTVEAVAPGIGVPTGLVTFTTTGGGSPSCSATLSDGSGACDLPFTSPGGVTVIAVYGGDAGFEPHFDTEGHTVNKAGTATNISSDSPDPSVVGQSVAVSITVEAVTPGSGTPTGLVTVTTTGGGNPVCTAALSGGSGICDLTFTSTGDVTITASYGGSTSFNSSLATAGHTVQAHSLVADFDYYPKPACIPAGDTVVFTNTSTTDGPPISEWQWDFGDGTASVFTQDATHTYTTVGTYTVSLVVTDTLGYAATKIVTDAVAVELGCNPLISVTFGHVGGVLLVDSPLTFEAVYAPLTATEPITYTWDFGDGTTTTVALASVQHAYATSGTFTVRLTAYNPCTPAGVSYEAPIMIEPYQVYLPLVIRNYR